MKNTKAVKVWNMIVGNIIPAIFAFAIVWLALHYSQIACHP